MNNINCSYHKWNLRINPSECESILFRTPRDFLSKIKRHNINDVYISTSNPNTKLIENIPTKKVVRYLGVHIDYLLRLNTHVNTQLTKAQNAAKANSWLFRNKLLYTKAQLICYQLLIRSILTYAAPIWWNLSASSADRLRVFERSCLRACLGKYFDSEHNYKERISNGKIYEEANIIRIDNFNIKLSRDYLSKLSHINNTSIIKQAKMPAGNYIRCLNSGYIPSQAFTYCDAVGIIQNQHNIPLLYHWTRNKVNKKIALRCTDLVSNPTDFKFSMAIPSIDSKDIPRFNSKRHWWLKPDNPVIILLKERLSNS